MRRLALLVAGGALWLVLAAIPALADGGPHQLAINNGTQGLSGDCAACHRAHTAKAESLLKEEMPGLCLACHDGTGATADVVDGYQYVPDGSGNPTGSVLGALRGGGFSYTLIDSSDAARVSIGGTQTVTLSAVPTGGSFTLHTPSGDTIVAAGATAASVQTALQGLYGTSTAYIAGFSATNLSSTPANGGNVTVSLNTAGTVYTITFQNTLRLSPQTLITVTAQSLTNASGPVTVATADTTQAGVRQMAAIPALTAGAQAAVPSTSTHEGSGTVWGNGASGTVGATGVVLDCAKCHNPHGNGQYRILQTTPGTDWTGATGVANWTAPTTAVEVMDAATASTTLSAAATVSTTSLSVASAAGFPSSGQFTIYVDNEQMLVTAGQGTTSWTVTRGANGTTAAAHVNTSAVYARQALAAGQVRNYTVKAGNLTTNVNASGTGDYWRYKYDPSGTANWTNFYLKKDDMNTGWSGTAPTNKAANGGVAPASSTGLMTAWCIQCHTRYSTAPALSGGAGANADTGDPTYTFRHSTSSSVGCEQCHVSHGTSAAMTAQFSSAVTFPNGSPEDSALLKLPNRGTCNMCHDPTGTVTPGTVAGASSTVPANLTNKY